MVKSDEVFLKAAYLQPLIFLFAIYAWELVLALADVDIYVEGVIRFMMLGNLIVCFLLNFTNTKLILVAHEFSDYLLIPKAEYVFLLYFLFF